MNIIQGKPFSLNHFKQWLLFCLVLVSVMGCQPDDDNIPNFPKGSTEAINLWVQDSLKRYYYWADQMPSKPNYHLPVTDFFKSLLSPQDRFSYILNTQDASTYPRSVRSMYGFDYTILQLDNGNVVTVVKLVLHNSPAQNAGLQRGMIITKINGTAITASNMNSVSESVLNSSSTITLSVGNWENGTIINEQELTVYQSFTFDQPLISEIFEQDGKKTAYLYIYDFPDGISGKFMQKFSEFKTAGVQELVLDLRYNYGGSVASAAALCAMIPAGISSSSPFIIYKGNRNGGEVAMTFAEQIAYDPSAADFNTLTANNLGLNKLYVLTSGNTASASEIVINNLKPYMQVVQVGRTSLGKDMAGFPIIDRNNPPEIFWQIHPVIYKVYNANTEGGYSEGISPQVSVDEFSVLPVLPLGNPDETLLSSVLGQIYSNIGGRKATIIQQSNILWESDRQQGIPINLNK